MEKKTQRIAIIRRNGLGDLLMTFPLIYYLKKWHAPCHITLFVDQDNAPLLSFLPDVEKLVENIQIFRPNGNKYVNVLSKALFCRKNKFDLGISAKTSPFKLNNICLFAMGAKKRVAYVDESWHRIFVNNPMPYEEQWAQKTHQALKCLQLVAPDLTMIPEEYYPKLHIPKEISSSYVLQPASQLPTILISCSNRRSESRFSPDRNVALLNRLYATYPFRVFLVGLAKDQILANLMTAGLKMEHTLHFPKSFAEFMSILQLSDLFFLGDGGVAHIAAALSFQTAGKELVVLYGQTLPQQWAPLCPKAEVLFHGVHVNGISDELILAALERKMQKIYEMKNLRTAKNQAD